MNSCNLFMIRCAGGAKGAGVAWHDMNSMAWHGIEWNGIGLHGLEWLLKSHQAMQGLAGHDVADMGWHDTARHMV